MSDLHEVRTPEQLALALRELVSETGKSPEDLAKRAGLTGNTVRGITSGKNWPQQRTLEQLVSACGRDARPWVNTWSPLNDARRREAHGKARSMQDQVDALETEVEWLRAQVNVLQGSVEQGEMEDQRRERRAADAYLVFLAQMPTPDFRRAEPMTTGGRMRPPSPLFAYSEPAYSVYDVNSLLDKVNEFATVEGLPQLAVYLATRPSFRAIVTLPLHEAPDNNVIYDYVKNDVETYLTKLRGCVQQYLRDCASEQTPPQLGSSAAPLTKPSPNHHQ